MTRDKIEKMILEIIADVDYDIYCNFIPENSEDPEESNRQLSNLIDIVEKYINE